MSRSRECENRSGRRGGWETSIVDSSVLCGGRSMEALIMVTATEVSDSVAGLGQVISGISTTKGGEKVVSVVFILVNQQ